jgi:hypothetical protein
MQRRALLVSTPAPAISTVGVLGSEPAHRFPLTPARPESTVDESVVVDRRDGERLLTGGVLHRSAPDRTSAPFEVTVPRATGTRLDDMRLRFTTDETPTSVPPEADLRRPTVTPFQPMEFGRRATGREPPNPGDGPTGRFRVGSVDPHITKYPSRIYRPTCSVHSTTSTPTSASSSAST